MDFPRPAAHALGSSRRRNRGLRAEAGSLLPLEGLAVVVPEQTQVSEGTHDASSNKREVGSKSYSYASIRINTAP